MWYKKRIYLLLVIILLAINVLAQDGKPKRSFKVDSVNINAGKYEDYYFRVTSDVDVVHVEPGKSKKFKMYLMRGDMKDVLHDVEVLGTDEKFTLEMEPEIVPQMRNIDAIIVYAVLHAPVDAVEGVYPLRISVKAKEFVEESYPIDTVVEVGKHTEIPSYFMYLIAAGFLGLMFWRKVNIKKLGK